VAGRAMPRIFISYRRDDSAAMTGRIFDRLQSRFGRNNVSMDIDTFKLGVDFRTQIQQAVGRCDVCLAVIGRSWLGGTTPESRRLDDPNDFVRIEIEAALARGIPVIPILIDQARMPPPSELPSSVADLTYRNAIEVDHGRDFHGHVDRLIRGIEDLPRNRGARRPAAAPRAVGRLVFGFLIVILVAVLLLPQVIQVAAPPPGERVPPRPALSPAPRKPKAPDPWSLVADQTPAPLEPVNAVVPASPVEITNSIGMKLVLIPAGEFPMGSETAEDPDSYDNEQPPHRVRITHPFYLGATEVTQGQYRAVMGQNPSSFNGSDDLPVETVSWNDAVAFCEKLNEKERALLGGDIYRLPTEAEWEYACRARSTTRYSFGNDAASLGDYAWITGNSGGKTHPVGQKRPNAFNLYDMHGNVYEWCQDVYSADYYRASPPADPPGPVGASARVVRGGGWDYNPRYARSANRLRDAPGDRVDDLGFRLARARTRVQSGSR
jgi:formylglycine-generating enzyme required for sulfatase activity